MAAELDPCEKSSYDDDDDDDGDDDDDDDDDDVYSFNHESGLCSFDNPDHVI